MVDGRETISRPLSGTLTVVDLDGTLVRGNTLHIYIMCAMRQMVHRRHVSNLLKVVGFLMARRLRLISHRTMKFGILGAAENTPDLQKDFVARINKSLRLSVRDYIARQRTGGAAILLATAAADVYVPWIWKDDFVATPIENNPGRLECRGERKRDLVQRYASKHKLSIDVVLTDHIDDLPILSTPGIRRVLVNPSTMLRTAVSAAALPIDGILE